MIAGSVAQTVFDAGTLENRQWAAEEATNQAIEQYRSVMLAAFKNVADVLRALQADARMIDAAVAAERSAGQNVSLVRRRVEQGQVNIALLIGAQQAFADITCPASTRKLALGEYRRVVPDSWRRMVERG